MDVFNTSNDLLKKAASFRLLHTGVGYDVVEELSSVRVLHDKIELAGCFDDLV